MASHSAVRRPLLALALLMAFAYGSITFLALPKSASQIAGGFAAVTMALAMTDGAAMALVDDTAREYMTPPPGQYNRAIPIDGPQQKVPAGYNDKALGSLESKLKSDYKTAVKSPEAGKFQTYRGVGKSAGNLGNMDAENQPTLNPTFN